MRVVMVFTQLVFLYYTLWVFRGTFKFNFLLILFTVFFVFGWITLVLFVLLFRFKIFFNSYLSQKGLKFVLFVFDYKMMNQKPY